MSLSYYNSNNHRTIFLEQPEAVAATARPASQIVGDFVTVIEVNGMKADGKPKNNDESSATSSPIEISASKKKIPPR